MMNKTIFLAAALLALGVAARAGFLNEAELKAALAQVTAQAYPDADRVLVDEVAQVTYAADGSATSRMDVCIKTLTEKGRRSQSTLGASFDTHYGSAVFTRVIVLKPDGRVLPVDVAAQSRVMTDQGMIGMNIFDPAEKVLQVSIPDLEVGDAVRYELEQRTFKSPIPNEWSDLTLCEDEMPIRRLVYEVLGPTNKPLRAALVKYAIGTTVTHTSGLTNALAVNRWEARDVPRYFPEPEMPSAERVAQRVLVSTTGDWKDISRWYWNACQPHLARTTPEMTNLVARLTANVADRETRLRAIFRFVSQDIRYMGITTETTSPGFEPHNVDMTFNNRYGVCRDKAALLVALLRIGGFDAYPVLIHAGPLKDEEVPQLWFNHAITGLREKDGSIRLMDSTDEHTKDLFPAYLGHCSFLAATPEGDPLRTSPVAPAESNLVRVETTGAFDAAGTLTGQTSLRFEGVNDNMYRGHFARLKPEDQQRFFATLIKRALPGATLTGYELLPAKIMDTTQPLTARMDFCAPDAVVRGKNLLQPLVPKFGASLGAVHMVLEEMGLDKRRFPMTVFATCGLREEVRVDAAALGGTVLAPQPQPVRGNVFSWQRHASASNGTLRVGSEWLNNSVEFSPADYLSFKNGLKQIEAAQRLPLLVQQPAKLAAVPKARAPAAAPEASADCRVLEEKLDVDVSDAHAWTTTRAVTKRILTYAGKKANGEIRIPYNPAWESAELVEANVTLPDGKVQKVVPEEINDMDADWVGGAPRYPAGRVRVVSLPGVEVGATLRYTVRRTCKDRPFFALLEYFQGFDPVDSKTLRVRAPRSLDLRVEAAGAGLVVPPRRREGEFITFVRSATNQPALRREDNLPPQWSLAPTVALSAGDWKKYSSMVKSALAKPAAGGAVAALAQKLKASSSNELDGVRAIRDFVARQIRTSGPALHELPLAALSTAEVTLKDGYGNSADCATLLHALLTAAGYAPEFVLASTLTRVPELAALPLETPQPFAFPEVLVRVRVGREEILLGDTDQYAALGATPHDGQPGLDLARGRVVTLRATPGHEERTAVFFGVHPAADGSALITVTNLYYGMAQAAFRRETDECTSEERRRHFQELVSDLSQNATPVGDYVTQTATYPAQEIYTVKAAHFAPIQRSLQSCLLPVVGANLNTDKISLPGVRADSRAAPLLWEHFVRAHICTTFFPSPEFSSAQLTPPDLHWRAPAGGGRVDCTTRTEKGALTIEREWNLAPAVIAPRRYGDLLDLNRHLTHPERTTLVLAQEPK